jgi:hypothetical protein
MTEINKILDGGEEKSGGGGAAGWWRRWGGIMGSDSNAFLYC